MSGQFSWSDEPWQEKLGVTRPVIAAHGDGSTHIIEGGTLHTLGENIGKGVPGTLGILKSLNPMRLSSEGCLDGTTSFMSSVAGNGKRGGTVRGGTDGHSEGTTWGFDDMDGRSPITTEKTFDSWAYSISRPHTRNS